LPTVRSPVFNVLLLLSSLLLASCGPSPTAMPMAQLPSATAAMPVAPTIAPAPSPTTSDAPLVQAAVPLQGEGVLAWTIAADGDVFVLDASQALYQLSPDTLAPLAQSAHLIDSKEQVTAYLVASEEYIFAGSSAISQTLVLDRNTLGVVKRLEGYGPLAVEPGRRLLMIPQGIEDAWPWGNFEIWAYALNDLDKAPEKIRNAGASFDDLVIDPDSGHLYVLTSNIGASPPHQGQTYEIYGLESLDRIGAVEWERGSLTRPVINPRTGEVVGSRIGLNGTRRVLILDQEGREVRSRTAVDGQPAVDVAGEWIYLLRQRGLWVLRSGDLSLQSIQPFSGTPPRDLGLSPDGETLYLFGNGWLSALPAEELRTMGFMPVSPLPTAWFLNDMAEHYVQPLLYRSPQMEKDGHAFVQLASGAENVLETYASTDGGQSWVLVTSMMAPEMVGAAFLSLSPDFAGDRTLTALAGSRVVRSTDSGLTWETWQPRIAFTSDRDGNREIYTMDLEGNDVQRLTDSPAEEENPAWSPAWTRLAFQSDRNGNWDILTMRADCDPSGPEAEERCDFRALTDDPGDDLLPAWSPDGRTIAFVSTRDGNPEIYVMDKDGGNQRRLTFNPTGDWRPAWLPDSTHLVFVSDRDGNNDVYEIAVPSLEAAPPLSEPELRSVIASPADDRDPAVGGGLAERLLFLSDRDGVMRVYVAEPHAQPRPFAETDQIEAHPATLPGQYYELLVSAEREGTTDIYRISLAGYSALASSPGFDGHPAGGATGWRPDTTESFSWLAAQEH